MKQVNHLSALPKLCNYECYGGGLRFLAMCLFASADAACNKVVATVQAAPTDHRTANVTNDQTTLVAVSNFVRWFVITGPPTHSVGGGGSIVLLSGICCHLSLSCVTLHGGPAGSFTRAGQAMTSCHLQSNYSSTVTLHGGPVVLRPVRLLLARLHIV